MTKNPVFRPSVEPKRTAVSTAVSAALIATTFGATAYAQDIEEIVVTATKREESVQDVPIAITALSGDFTQAVNLNDVKDLISFTPGITGNSQDSFIDAVSIRGVRTQDFGIGGDPSAAIFKNDLYEGRNGSAVTSLYDIERAEVLRGPQGFLFGRNSIGGAISVHTRKADIDGGNSGYIDVDVGERGHLVLEGALNVPVSDTFAMRFAGYHSSEDGFVPNFASNTDLIEHDKQGIRWSTTYENGALSFDTQVEYETREQSGSVYRAVTEGDAWDAVLDVFGTAITPAGGESDADSDQSLGDSDDADILTIGARLDYEFENFTLTSITGYKDHDFFYTEDYDGTPLNINNYRQDQEGDYLQQEIRLVSNTEGPLSWYAGMSFYKEEIETVFTNAGSEDAFCAYYGSYYYPGYDISDCRTLFEDYYYYGYAYTFYPSPDGLLNEPGTIRGDYSGWAAYVDLSLEISESVDVSLGIRHTNDEKEFIVNVPTPESALGPYWAYGYSTDGDIMSKADWSETTMRLVGRWRPTDSSMIYASYTEGYKSGGFGSFSLVDANGDRIGGVVFDVDQASGARARQFQPEQADSYELGYKGSFGGTDLSLSGFIYDYEDLQISFFDTDSGANTVENVGQVDGLGIEATLTTQFNDNWDGYLALSWLDTDATGLQAVCDGDTPDSCEGSKLFWAPDWAGAAVLNGRFDVGNGTVKGSLEVFFESERGGGWAGLPETMIDSYVDATLRIDYESGGQWTAGIYVENLTDEFTYDGLNNNGGIIPAHFFGHKRPRTAGVRFGYSWE
ncbi:MAG: TonB-dependent receptor [Gammaproteobacteria bacterium]|nr:TonB-dependent receptor [Gammaproteobacteria bacterium]NNF49696.1 TonB-dependent receptor [Woeseiaceae bacterium]MBT8095159.1 TonB-dependent receptor [Gammaproteobacteria bacterium]MBT8106180.1 TonB-dependent receptor [Gammaproteobacteria bacterium]NNK26194.1 TonB-dependent receptor [Woeseiaceae bacterium]